MTAMPGPQEVREIVVRSFVEFGAKRPHLLRETILVSRGRYLARSYRLEGLLAMWHIEEGVLRLYDARRRVLRTINLFGEVVPQRMVA